MSLDVDRRVRRYLDQTGRKVLTPRQARRAKRKTRRYENRQEAKTS